MIFYLAFYGIIAIAGAFINVAINNASAKAKRILKHLLIQGICLGSALLFG